MSKTSGEIGLEKQGDLIQIEDYIRREKWEKLPFDIVRLPEKPRILILKLSAIGDCLIASPVARAVRQQFPEAHIAWAVQDKAKAVVEGNPDLDEVLVWRGGWKGALKLAGEVRARKFDVILNLQPQFKSAPILALGGVKIRVVTSRADPSSRFLSNRIVPIPENQPHASEQYLRVAHAIGIPLDARPEMRLPLSAEERDWANSFLIQNNRNADKKLVALNPASLRLIKAWPPEQWKCLVTLMTSEGIQPLVIGGPKDIELASAVAAIAPDAIMAAGKTNLKQLGALLERCDLLVSADTGPMHIGAAAGTKILALFGPTDPALTGPLTKNGTVIVRDLPCRPCLQQPTCERFECLTELKAEEIWPVVRKLVF
jgi:lipopolysaccharide heptosyltransferase II